MRKDLQNNFYMITSVTNIINCNWLKICLGIRNLPENL